VIKVTRWKSKSSQNIFRAVRDMIELGEFVEVFFDTPFSVAKERRVKGLYAKARFGQHKNF